MTTISDASQLFIRTFGAEPTTLVHAPGRVNLIGEHTDYNNGFVFPLAIDRGTDIAVRATASGKLRMVSSLTNEKIELPLGDAQTPLAPVLGWVAYVYGPLQLLRNDGVPVSGLDVALSSDLPIGAGLSSSASVEIGVATAVLALAHQHLSTTAIALLCQRAEQQAAGVNCGIMDQLVVAEAREGHALFIDCQSLAATHTALPRNVAVLVLNTHASRELAASAYNARRTACERAVAVCQRIDPGVRSLRDVSLRCLAEALHELDDETARCAHHVLEENARVLSMGAALARGDLAACGEAMVRSHYSLRANYRVSSPALDAMVNAALAQPEVLGARMTGAGFGGCCVALVRTDDADAVLPRILARYATLTSTAADGFITTASSGAHVIQAP